MHLPSTVKHMSWRQRTLLGVDGLAALAGANALRAGDLQTATEQAELILDAVWQLGVERPVVVGHSFGAMVALALAERYPADVAELVRVLFLDTPPDVLLVVPGPLPVWVTFCARPPQTPPIAA